MSEASQAFEPGQHPDLPPPRLEVGALGWLRRNLFSTWYNALLTIFAFYLVYLLVPPVIQWAVIDADWVGETREACSREGACWVFIRVWFDQLIYGRYPVDERWRVNLAFVILIIAAVPLFVPGAKGKQWIGAFLLIGFPVIAVLLFYGFSREAAAAMPYWIMASAALAVATIVILPFVGPLRRWSRQIGWGLIVVVPIWSIAVPATSPTGLSQGVSWFPLVVSITFAAIPTVVLAGRLFLSRRTRELFREGAWPIVLAVALAALVGYALALFFWDSDVSPPALGALITLAALLIPVIALFAYPGLPLPATLAVFLIYLLAVLLAYVGLPAWLPIEWLSWKIVEPVFVPLTYIFPEIETPLWGGLFLTLVIGGVGIVMSLPIGVVLALGRRSQMPIVRAVCVAFIELWRGVPLITVLFMSSVMFPLFLPEGVTFDKLIRALVGVMLFSAAYMAEVVRGGLQAIPKGQYEGAQALGLSYWKMMGLIVLPQALKLVIPGIVNTFIGLFKDTTLVLIIGLFDFLGMVQLVGTNPDWLGFAVEGYVFAAFGFWIFCFGMSRYSMHLEKKLHTGH